MTVRDARGALERARPPERIDNRCKALHTPNDTLRIALGQYHSYRAMPYATRMEEPKDRLIRARRDAGYETPTEAAHAFGWSEVTYAAHEGGRRGIRRAVDRYARAFRVSVGWLLTGEGDPKRADLVPVVGKVGATPDGAVRFAEGQGTGDFAPLPPGGNLNSVALEVDGHSMRGYADNGALIYFEDQKRPPTDDMIGEVVVVETDDGDVLVKRLFRGSREGLFDLESIAGPRRTDAVLRWAAHITAVIPPRKAREIIRRDLAA